MLNAHEPYVVEFLHPVAVRTATGNGAGIDVRDFVGRGKLTVDCAAGTGTTPTLDIRLQDSEDNVTFADIPGLTFAQVTTVASQQQRGITLDAVRRFIRVAFTVGGTTPSFTFSATLQGWRQG